MMKKFSQPLITAFCLLTLFVLTDNNQKQVFAQTASKSVSPPTVSQPSAGQPPAGGVTDSPSIDAAISQANLLSRAFREASKHIIPATVKVETVLNDGDDMPAGRMFPFDSFPKRRGAPNTGLGTGIIIDAEKGLILTNNHVIADAKEAKVILSDGREYKVLDKKFDRDSDLALLTIHPDSPLTAATFADSDNIDIGDWVLAVGNPFDLESTVSVGIISARWRTMNGVDRGDFLQTDAAINPGNSGGPLINLKGEVVGINTAIVSQSGSNSGVGFAIASNTAHWVARQLAEKGRVDRAYLGIQIAMVDAKRATESGVRPKEGVYVAAANDKTPAKDAGIQAHDIILAFDGRKINSPSELQSVVERSDVDKTHEVTILRDKNTMKMPIKVAIMPEGLRSATQTLLGGQAQFHNDKALGLQLLKMSLENANRYGYEGLEGMIIVNVAKGSLAAQAGLETKMLITKVDGKPVAGTDEYAEARKASSLENGVTLTVQTEKGEQTFVIKQTKK
ncbi:MAG: trypsin-like peptidase domain-containing protein [Planctomycetaceae bacterium]|nr:trypsin-like peptidase domain-containing protein [Planctomycetaceae bacterium]